MNVQMQNDDHCGNMIYNAHFSFAFPGLLHTSKKWQVIKEIFFLNQYFGFLKFIDRTFSNSNDIPSKKIANRINKKGMVIETSRNNKKDVKFSVNFIFNTNCCIKIIHSH